jgi:uncharacterized protein (TIGR02284 family)
LNSLVEATLDSAQGYEAAARNTRNPDLRALFEQRAAARDRLTVALWAEIRGMGGNIPDGATVPTSLCRVFQDLENAVAGSDADIVREVEARELRVKARFAEVLQAQSLPCPVARVVNDVYAVIQADKDRLRALLRDLRARSGPLGAPVTPPMRAEAGHALQSGASPR